MPVTKFSLVWILMGLAVFVYVLQIGTITKRTILRKPAWADIGALAQPSGGKAEPCVTGPNVEPLPVVASANHTGPPTIFVSVAAFRDVETNATLHSLFSRALYPQRVFVGLVCQVDWNNPAELCVPPKVWEQECGTQEWCPMDQIRMRTFDAGRARGPTFARHLASLLYRGEDYFMMIDSHNRFVKHWDQVVIDEHAKTGRMNSVLTTYPMAINPKDEEVEERSIAFLCALGKNAGWTSGFPGPYWANSYRAARYPKPQPYLGAGLVFGPGRMVLDVPFDPYLPYLFFGEEFLLGVRLWTHGYDLYSPGVNILYHRYGRKGPRMETLGSQVSSGQRTSHKRVQHIIGLPKQGRRRERMVPLNTTDPALNAGLPKYGLGTVRSLWQWWQFAKLDPIVQNKQTFTDHWCTTYGPRTGKPDDNWKEFAKENDVPAEEWWHKGVAILAVPQDHPSLAKYPAFCTDQLTECSDLVAEGKCSTDKSVRRLCALSCSACEVPRIEQAGEAGVR